MRKYLVPLAAGAVVGAALMWLGGAGGEVGTSAGGPQGVLESVARFASSRNAASVDRVSVSDQLAAYRAVADERDPGRLQRAIETAASRPPSLERDVGIDAALGRLAAFAPALAVDTVLALGLEDRFVVEAFALFADADADAAVAALSRIDRAGARHAAAAALIGMLGDNAAARNRVAAALPSGDRNAVIAMALAQRAEIDPFGALRDAQSLDDESLMRQVVTYIAREWVREDPNAALAQADLLPESMAAAFRASAHEEWAKIDTDGYASYLEAMGRQGDESAIASGLSFVIASDPERALRIAETLTGTLGLAMQTSAWRELGLRDPAAALAGIGALPVGQLRDRIATSVAAGLASRDPDGALEWAAGLNPPVPGAVRSILMAIAQSDPLRALELIDRPDLGSESTLLYSVLSAEIRRSPGREREFANQLVQRQGAESNAALQSVVASWMQRDTEAALDWVLDNDIDVETNVLSNAAQTMARSDPAAAAAFAARLPDRHRAAWVTQVAGHYGRVDPDAALAWVGQFQGQPYFNVAMRDAIAGAATTNPRAAASAMARANAEVQLGTAPQIAQSWAQTEPRAAADWALGIADTPARDSALTGAVGTWAQADFAAARSWTLRLPEGPARDRAITGIVGRSAVGAAEFDWDLVAAIEDDMLRQQSAGVGIGIIARTDPRRAEQLLDSEISDPNMRQQTRQLIDRMRQLSPTDNASGILILPR